MKLRDKIVSYSGAALILGASIFGGGQIAGHFKTFNPNYWRQEIVEEKQKRLDVLDEVSKFDKDGKYSVQEIAELHDGLIYATMLFNYMDCDKGDLKADDSPISPGDALMGDMNVKYRRLFQKYGNIIAELSNNYIEMRGVPKDKIPEVKRVAGEISRTDREEGYEVLQNEIRKYSPEISQKILDLSQSDLDEKVNSAITGVKSILTDQKLQEEDLKNADFKTGFYKYMVGGVGGAVAGLLGCLGLGFLYERKKS